MKKVVTIGGGTGQFVLLSALKDLDIELTAIVSMTDNGGSSGRLRDEYGVLPPGDVLKCLVALSPYKEAREILQTRFKQNEKLQKHKAGNFLLAFLSQYLGGDFPAAVEAMSEILNIKGRVLPVTTDKATLVAELDNGEHIYGETVIDIVNQERKNRIKKTFLVPHSVVLNVYAPVVTAIESADYIIIGPGDIYTSITPNFLVPGVNEAISRSKAKLVYISNIMTKYGETDGLTGEQMVEIVEKYLERKFDLLLVNEAVASNDLLARYKLERAEPVSFQRPQMQARILLSDFLAEGQLARHDTEKLKKILIKVLV